jgi:hypothetical protein
LSRGIFSQAEMAWQSGWRGDNPLSEGLLGTAASRAADLVLLLEIAMMSGAIDWRSARSPRAISPTNGSTENRPGYDGNGQCELSARHFHFELLLFP